MHRGLLCLLSGLLSFRFPSTSPHSPSLPPPSRLLSGFLPPTHPQSDSNSISGFPGFSGLIPVKSDGSSLFYWLIQRIGGDISTDQAPILLWLQGGPGCSSLIGNFYEIGPMEIEKDLRIKVRNETWALDSHLLFIDNPFGAGFSFTNSESYVHSDQEMATYLHTALLTLCRMHPKWFEMRDLYIFGESYAGKFIVNIAEKVLNTGNFSDFGCEGMRLKGVGLGNSWIEPVTQTLSMSNYSHAAGIVSDQEKRHVSDLEKRSKAAYETGHFSSSNQLSFDVVTYIIQATEGINPYNIREYGDYDLQPISHWLNRRETKSALHVPEEVRFSECSDQAYSALEEDQMIPVSGLLGALLDRGLRVLIYTGQDDLICNILGTERYVEDLEWRGRSGFRNTEKKQWKVQGEVAGYVRKHENLMLVLIRDAGHLVPHDQPSRSRALLRLFLGV